MDDDYGILEETALEEGSAAFEEDTALDVDLDSDDLLAEFEDDDDDSDDWSEQDEREYLSERQAEYDDQWGDSLELHSFASY